MTLDSEARAIARAGIRAVDPRVAVRRVIRRDGRRIRLGRWSTTLPRGGRLHLLAIGKAAAAMADGAVEVLGSDCEGLTITPRGFPAPRRGIPVLYGEHPVPGPGSFRAGSQARNYVAGLGPLDTAIYLISGGGSAVAEIPAQGVSPRDLAATTRLLLGSGAPIAAMNAVRRHLSAIKGGQLALAGRPRWHATVALSDVVGDRPADIASGLTVGDPSTFRDALRVVREWRLVTQLPRAAVHRLEDGARGALPETPRPTHPGLRGAPFVLAASNRLALAAAAREARQRGFRSRVLSSRVVGETQPVARAFARSLLAHRGRRPIALLAGGETTVTLSAVHGRGGRNQEFALVTAPLLDGRKALILSIGTDGIDGPTDAAGGWVDGRTAARARAQRVDLAKALADHSSYAALDRLGGLVRTGPTGTNVMDLHVGLVAARDQSRYGGK